MQEGGPGDEIEAHTGERLPTVATWSSHYPIAGVEVLFNGRVVASDSFPGGSKAGQLEADVPAESDGWIAARVSTDVRDSYQQPVFAHTSPVYVKTGLAGPERSEAARGFDRSIEENLKWVRTRGKFHNDKQRREVVDLHREGQQMYRAMIK